MPYRKEFEQFQDFIARMYPAEHPFTTDKKDRVLTKSVTFQICDECNLCCFPKGTKILMADFSEKPIEDVKVGDYVIGFPEYPNQGKYKQLRITPTRVTHVFSRHAMVREIKSEDGGHIICTDEHPFLSERKTWMRAEKLTTGSRVMRFCGTPQHEVPDIHNKNYMIGYIVSAFLGDGSMGAFKNGELREKPVNHQNRLAVKDVEIIDRVKDYLDRFNVNYYVRPYLISPKYSLKNDAIYIGNPVDAEWLWNLILNNWLKNTDINYYKGFLAGIIDTEGHVEQRSGYVRIFNSNENILKECENALNAVGCRYTYDKPRKSKNYVIKAIRTLNELRSGEGIAFLRTVFPAVKRKGYQCFYEKSMLKRTRIVENTPCGKNIVPVFNIETESHTYIANDFAVHNCTYCYQINKGKRRMKLEYAKKLIDMLLTEDPKLGGYITLKNSPGLIIEFIGGEPFLAIDLIEQICDYFYSRAIELMHPWAEKSCISICSNGVLYFDPRVQRFLNKYKNKISLSISIDGNKQLHDACRVFEDGSGSYDMAVKAAKDWMSRGYEMGSKITIAPQNLKYIYDAIIHMVDLGYYTIHANTVYENVWKPEHATQFYYELKRIADYWVDHDLVDTHYLSLFEEDAFCPQDEDDIETYCGGTGSMLAIDPDGYLYPCIRYMESSIGDDQEPLRIGHVNYGIAQRKCDKDCVDCLNAVTRRTESTDECFYCPIGMGCGECSAYNYQMFGTPDHKGTFHCEMHKARALANVYFWNKWYRKQNENKRFEMHCPENWALNIIPKEEYDMLLRLSEVDCK